MIKVVYEKIIKIKINKKLIKRLKSLKKRKGKGGRSETETGIRRSLRSTWIEEPDEQRHL